MFYCGNKSREKYGQTRGALWFPLEIVFSKIESTIFKWKFNIIWCPSAPLFTQNSKWP